MSYGKWERWLEKKNSKRGMEDWEKCNPISKKRVGGKMKKIDWTSFVKADQRKSGGRGWLPVVKIPTTG